MMKYWLIYIVGYIVSFGIAVHHDMNNDIAMTTLNYVYIAIYSLLSWVAVISDLFIVYWIGPAL